MPTAHRVRIACCTFARVWLRCFDGDWVDMGICTVGNNGELGIFGIIKKNDKKREKTGKNQEKSGKIRKNQKTGENGSSKHISVVTSFGDT